MTTTLETPAPAQRPETGAPAPRRVSRRRLGVVVVLIAGLIGAGALRSVAMDYQAQAAGLRGVAAPRNTLGNMNSYALALLLGGLRGPLVMFLWSTSETQKADRDLEDLDTKIEWIRLLQPEFDTVHMFQMWNKAYNISVMMSSPANKYSVIMEAIDYGQKVDQERPGDLNILGAIGGIYSGKLAAKNLPECPYYMRQFREESMSDASRKQVYPEDNRTFHHLSDMKPLLDDKNELRADLITPKRGRPTGEIPGGEWNDGSELQYLAPFKKFPLGVSPVAMAYNYAKRAQVAQTAEGQKPLQLSPMVIDSQPALQLKAWADDEGQQGRAYEAKAFGLSPDLKSADVQAALAALQLDQKPADPKALSDAIFCYNRAISLDPMAVHEYRRHMSNPEYAARINIYQSHLADLESLLKLSTADRDYLQAMLATGSERTRLLQEALKCYREGLANVELTVLDYYTDGDVFTDPHYPKPFVDLLRERKLNDSEENQATIAQAYAAARAVGQLRNFTQFHDEQADYARTLARCAARISSIEQAMK